MALDIFVVLIYAAGMLGLGWYGMRRAKTHDPPPEKFYALSFFGVLSIDFIISIPFYDDGLLPPLDTATAAEASSLVRR